MKQILLITLIAFLSSFVSFTLGYLYRKPERIEIVKRDTVYVKDTFYLRAKGCDEIVFTGSLITAYSSSLATRIFTPEQRLFYLQPYLGFAYSTATRELNPYIGLNVKYKSFDAQMFYIWNRTIGIGIGFRF